MPEETTQKINVASNKEEAIKKTAETYKTVSEEKILEEAKNIKKTTEKMIKEDTKTEKEISEKEKEEKIVKLEKKDVKTGKPKRRDRRAEEAAQHLASWVPKTKLGREAREGKIKNIDELIENNKKILESEVVDTLIPGLKIDLISQGQAKGKFGGGKRRAWRQTQRITREGGVVTFSAMAIAGDSNGHIGLGVGKAGETLPARDKATKKAKLNLIKITRGCSAFDCSCSENHSIPFEVEGKSGSVRLTLIPAPQGTGLVVANELKKVLKLAGIKDVYSKAFGQKRTTFNLIKACMNALEETNRK